MGKFRQSRRPADSPFKRLQKKPARKSTAGIGPVGIRITMAGNCRMMLRQFIGRLLDQPDRPSIAAKCDLIDEGRNCCNVRPWVRQGAGPIAEPIHWIAQVDAKMVKQGLCESCCRSTPVQASADEIERPLPDPMTAALVTDEISPAAGARRLAFGVTRPRH